MPNDTPKDSAQPAQNPNAACAATPLSRKTALPVSLLVAPQASDASKESHAAIQACPTSQQGAAAAGAYERRSPSADDVVIVSACRTALCKARRGGFRDTHPTELVCAVLQDMLRRTAVEPEVGGRVIWGAGVVMRGWLPQ